MITNKSSVISPNQISEFIRSAFDFSVIKLPLSGPDNMKTPWYGLFRDDLGESIGGSSVSKRYEPHRTSDVVSLVESAAAAFDSDVKLTCAFRQGHYVSVAPADDSRRTIYGTRDNIFPRIVISAGYNGSPFRAHLGYYRDLCKNLSMLRTVQGTSVSIIHTRSLRSKMSDLIDIFSGLRDGWQTLGATIEHLDTREVDLGEFLLNVYGTPSEDSKRSVTIHTERMRSIFTRVRDERLKSGRNRMVDYSVSAWEAYNAVQGYVQHDAPRKGPRKSSFERAILAASDKYVKAAEDLAMSARHPVLSA